MPADDLHAVDGRCASFVDVGPAYARRCRGASERVERRESRDRNAFPDVTRTKLSKDGERAADVIGIAVRQREAIDPPKSRLANDRRDHTITDVEAGPERQPAGVNKHRRSSRKHDENRVALPYIYICGVQTPVASCRHERSWIDENPEHGAGKNDSAHRNTYPRAHR